MTNGEIYTKILNLSKAFSSEDRLPIKLNYYIQRNLAETASIISAIETNRMKIGEKYGEQTQDGYQIPPEKAQEANKELTELMEIDQPINLLKIKFSDIPQDLVLTTNQMEALMFIIEDEEKED